MNIQQALNRAVNRQHLNRDEMTTVMQGIMTGQYSEAQIAAFLTAMRMKGESIEEITGAALVLRRMVTPVNVSVPHLVDIVGTGGDGAHLFNVSTAASFAAAAAGAHVAKHGNRGVSSSSGSADLLERAGIELDQPPERVARAVEQVGVGFMFAPAHHPAMRYVATIRKELGMRSFFNLLGPMSNPAGVDRLLVGVFDQTLCRPVAEVLRQLGCRHVMVVHSDDGLDEISIAGETHVSELNNDHISEYQIKPEQFGIHSQSLNGLDVDNAAESLALIRDALGQREGEYAQKAAEMITLNAGAALYVSGVSATLQGGIDNARQVIDNGQALAKMEQLSRFTQTPGKENNQ